VLKSVHKNADIDKAISIPSMQKTLSFNSIMYTLIPLYQQLMINAPHPQQPSFQTPAPQAEEINPHPAATQAAEVGLV
jgi:hypothetical protein